MFDAVSNGKNAGKYVKTSLIQSNSATLHEATLKHTNHIYRILSQISGKNHELTTSGASSMKCVVKTTTRPSRAARMMFHVALRLYGSIPVHCRKLFWSSISFDINQNQVAVLPQLWSVAKNWNDIGRICCSFGCFISISCICNLNITMKSD